MQFSISKALSRMLGAVTLTLFATTVQALPAGLTEGPTIEGVTEYQLDNGLKILLAPDASKPTTTVNMTYLVGSRHERYGQTGMAHLLEHLLFRGTPSIRNALAEFSRRGLAANGTTSADRTNYYASFAADPETLEWYVRWQADAMVNSLIAKEDLDAEMTVVRNEMERGENSPFRILLQQMQSAAFQWHNYGNNTIGARSDVENVDIGQLQEFYRTYYQPDNAVLIVSGQFDAEPLLDIIADAFGDIPRPKRPLPPEYTVEPVQDGERKVTLRREGGSPLIAALFHAPPAANEDYSALELGVGILADTPSGRLYRDLVGQKKASSVFGFASDNLQPGYVFFGAELEPGMDQEDALNTLNSSLASVAGTPFQQEDLERIRSQWLTGWINAYADPASLASALSEATAVGDWRLFFLLRDRVENMSLDQVQRVTQRYLVTSNRTNGLYIPTESPERAPAPTMPDLEQLFADYQGKETRAVVETFVPTPDNINAATQRDPLALANGTVELALLPKETRGDRVHAQLVLQFADAEGLKGKRTVSSAVADLLDHGTSKLSRQDIQDAYTRLQASVGIGGSAGTVVVNMSTMREHLPELTRLVLSILREANFPESELAEYKSQAHTAIRNAMAQPDALAIKALARHDNPWPADDVRYTPTFDEELSSISALTRDDLLKFHDEFYGAGTLRFAAVGSFDPEAVKTAIREGVEGWQEAPAYTRISDPYREVQPEIFDINTPDKANAFYVSVMPLELQDTDPDYPALYLANYLLGSSETSRLWNRVRVEEGLSYDVRSRLGVSSYEPSAQWTIYAIHAPQNSDKLKTVIREELDKVLQDGFTDEEVQQGITALLNYRKLARTRDSILASAWVDYLQLDRTFDWSKKMDAALSALTADDVNAALRKYLDPERFSVALAADQAKQQEAASAAPPEPTVPDTAPQPGPDMPVTADTIQ